MAVSMNSGFMRSDYMISDAALPLRMEELDIEQLDREAKFSDILGEIGNTPAEDTTSVMTDESEAAPEMPVVTEVAEADTETPVNDVSMLSKSELKALARAIAQGKVKPDEIPQEYVSDILMMIVAMMMLGIPEDEIPVPENHPDSAVRPVRMDAASAEAFIAKVQENTDVQGVLQMVSETAGLEIPEDMKREFGRQIETVSLMTDEVPKVSEEPVQTDTNVVPAGLEATAAVTEQAVTQNVHVQEQAGSTAQTDVNAQTAQQAAPAEQTKLTEEFEQLRRVITEYTVKHSETEQPAQQSYMAQTVVTENTAKSRVVSKSEELEILKTAAKPTEQLDINAAAEGKSEAQADTQNGSQSEADLGADAQQLPMEQMPQGMVPQAPIVFVRDDGTQVEVRPSEVIRQITESIVEQTTTADGDTEYSITLTPEDLGSITVKLTKTVDGAMTVSITAENARTQRLIEQHGAAIQENLKQNNIELENWQTVNQSEQQYRAQDYNGSSGNPYYRDDSEDEENEDADDTSFAELISAM